MTRRSHIPAKKPQGMTLLEVLVASVILSTVLLAIMAAIQTMQASWVRVRGKTDPYRNARMVLDTMSRRISEATLQQRWAIEPRSNGSLRYVPQSDLHFVSGPVDQILGGGGARRFGHAVFFQSTRGWDDGRQNGSTSGSIPEHDHQENSLNAWGYYIEFGGEDYGGIPSFLSNPAENGRADSVELPIKERFRLYEWRQTTGELQLFTPQDNIHGPTFLSQTQDVAASRRWFQEPLSQGGSRRQVSLIAENVIAFTIVPIVMDQNGQPQGRTFPNGIYDTRDRNNLASYHRLPKAFQLTALIVSPEAWAKQSQGQRNNLGNQLVNWTTGKFRDAQRVESDFRDIGQQLDNQRPALPYQIINTVIPMAEGSAKQVAPQGLN
jgi:uncharacterized protein (TIGR02599 family)